MRWASSRHSSSRLGPSAAGGKEDPALIARQRVRKLGVSSSSSAHKASSLLAAGSSCVATVAAIRNLAGRRFSATSRYHDSAPRIAGSSQILSWAKSLICDIITAPPARGTPGFSPPCDWNYAYRLATGIGLIPGASVALSAPGTCSHSACQESYGSVVQDAQLPAACHSALAVSPDPWLGSVSLICPSRINL